MPLSEDEASLGDEEFIVLEDPVEQERFKRRLIATANSLKKKQQQPQADQDLLADRWTEVLAAEEYELERPTKSYPKRRLLPQLEEEALKPTLQRMMRLTGHLVAETKRHISPKSSPHPVASQTKTPRPGATRRTCKTYWKTKQDIQDRSMDHGGAPQRVTTTVMPDIHKANPAGPNTADKTRMNCVVI